MVRYTRSSDRDAANSAAAAQQVASTNSTVNAFLPGKPRSWMLGVDLSPPSRTARTAEAPSTSNEPSVTVLPSPAPSDEPSPVQAHQTSPVQANQTTPDQANQTSSVHANQTGPDHEARVIRPRPLPSPPLQQVNTRTEPTTRQTSGVPPTLYTQQTLSLSSATQPNKRRKMTPTNFPSLKPRLQIIEQHIASTGLLHGLEEHRFRLLRNACNNSDYFYVALHQIFSLWYLDPAATARIEAIGDRNILDTSLQIVAKLIMDNSGLQEVHRIWFSEFPTPLAELVYRSDHYRLTVENVMHFLARLAVDWHTYTTKCIQRGFPPLVDELVNHFGLTSPLLQHVFFTATRRNLGAALEDEYSAHMERLFEQDRETHRQMAARYNTAYPPTQREVTERNEWLANQYITLRRQQMSRLNVQQSVPYSSNRPPHVGPPQPYQIQTQTPAYPLLSQPPAAQPSPTLIQFPSSHFISPQFRTPQYGGRNVSFPEHPPQSPFTISNPLSAAHFSAPNAIRQTQNTHRTQSQTSDIVRSDSQNPFLPQRQQNVQFPHSSQTNAPPVATNPLRSSGTNQNGPRQAPMLANMPAGQTTTRAQQQQTYKIALIPPTGFNPPFQPPCPESNALHQAHLRSPVLRPIDVDEGLTQKEPLGRYYQAVQSFAVEPIILSNRVVVTEFPFTVPEATFSHIDAGKVTRTTAPVLRKVKQGSLQYRIRCGQLRKDSKGLTVPDWIVADSVWPTTIFIEINDFVLEMRRKKLHAKDLPIDITPHVVYRGADEENIIKISIPKSSQKKGITYAFAVEVVEMFKHQQILDLCLNDQRIPAEKTLNDIKTKLSGQTDDDDDIAMVSADLTIDLADPFTSRIFGVPVRGSSCIHRECFDLETFLVTRNSKPGRPEQPCMVDVWKCPLCGRDARPRSLRVDDFFVAVRERLERDGELDVKAIVVSQDGSWKPKPEALPAKGRGGSYSRFDEEDAEKEGKMEVKLRQGSRPVEIIELDDD